MCTPMQTNGSARSATATVCSIDKTEGDSCSNGANRNEKGHNAFAPTKCAGPDVVRATLSRLKMSANAIYIS